MPKIKSAIKRVKTSEVRRLRNNANKSRLNTARRSFLEVIAAGDAAKSMEAYKEFCSVIDKSAKKGVISKNAAARRKSRAYAKLNVEA